MALLYGMISLDDILVNNSKEEKFVQHILLPNNVDIYEYMPMLKAPVSTVQFWMQRLHLTEHYRIKSFSDYGYSSLNELIAEMKGFYKFYTKSR